MDFETDILAWQLPFWKGEEKDLTEGVLNKHRFVSIFTLIEHNDVLAKTGLFQQLLSASPFLKQVKHPYLLKRINFYESVFFIFTHR